MSIVRPCEFCGGPRVRGKPRKVRMLGHGWYLACETCIHLPQDVRRSMLTLEVLA